MSPLYLSCVYHSMNAYDWLVLTLLLPLICSLAFFALAAAASLAKRAVVGGSWSAAMRQLRPALCHLHLWLGLLLYPSLSRQVRSAQVLAAHSRPGPA